MGCEEDCVLSGVLWSVVFALVLHVGVVCWYFVGLALMNGNDVRIACDHVNVRVFISYCSIKR